MKARSGSSQGIVVIDAGGRAGDDDALERPRIGEGLAVRDRHHVVGEALPGAIEHGLEHLADRGRTGAQGVRALRRVWMMVSLQARP